MIVRIRRIFDACWFDDETVGVRPPGAKPSEPPDSGKLPDAVFRVDVPGEEAARMTVDLAELIAFGIGEGTRSATAAELVAWAIAGVHGVKLVESIVMPEK